MKLARKYPHLKSGNASAFPDIDNVNAYKFDNDFDYSRYDSMQMRLQLCNVPWDMGEAHVGNRTINGIGNVVHFGSVEKRNEYFAKIPDTKCLRFETKYKNLHKDGFIVVPVPFDVAARYNYVAVEYSSFANDESFVEFEKETGIKNWYWFIREVEMIAPNSTKLHVLPDVWQTCIYDLKISSMMLERGHAPMFAISADEYLNNPIENNEHLLAEDVNFDSGYVSRYQDEFIFNSGNMKAVIFTSARLSGFGSKEDNTWNTPTYDSYSIQGITNNYRAFCIDATDLSTFLANVNSDIPQFMQTIKAIAFASADLLYIVDTFTFAGVTCRNVGSTYKQNNLLSLNKEMFAFGKRYENIAKLYTYPYSFIEVTDENGNVSEIRIEDTNGSIKIESCFNLVYPFLKLTSHLTGIGYGRRKKVTFSNVNSRNMPLQGNWYKTIREWDIPCYGVIQSNAKFNDYNTYFDRVQAESNAITNKENANENANATRAVGSNNAACITNNGALAVALNNTTAANISTKVGNEAASAIAYSDSTTAASNAYTDSTTTSSIDASKAQASVAATGSVINSIASAATNPTPSNVIGSLVSGAVGAGTAIANGAITAQCLEATRGANATYNLTTEAAAASATNRNMTIARGDANRTRDANNSFTSGTSANTAAREIANANANANAIDANAARSYLNELEAIDNSVRQAGLGRPQEFGSFANGDTAATRPIGLFANIITQPKGVIRQTADEFLRYGYSYNGIWDFDGNWNIGKHFTYWKLSDFWVSGLTIPDKYMDQLRFFLYGGVTIWSKPESIGNVSIYENGR